ncbi:hypothetical protein D7X30_08365 [Corallococcus sp. AB011P]|uniref:hypothetical protein n=1 Tax=unclassified Corallococcus TaxID=2685029 RepID=UPI000EA3D1AB|nr:MULTISPECIES: hypothetical protein [unclassified Corallococcus]RKG60910.1 hypothetical protein D7X30_08365 [Corallococcus sp. AB011P]RKH81231.1 hypothetical protein D7Y21_30575 [Corallococcus sp. AB045]
MFPLSRTLVVLNLMFFGAGLALFVQGQRASENNRELETRLERMEGRLDQLLSQRQAPAVALSGAPSPALPSDLEARIEQAVSRALQAQAPHAPPREDPAPQEPPAPDTRNAEAWARGNEVVERALSARRWGDAQARELAASVPSLTQQQQLNLLRRLSVAINEGQLKVETLGPPF